MWCIYYKKTCGKGENYYTCILKTRKYTGLVTACMYISLDRSHCLKSIQIKNFSVSKVRTEQGKIKTVFLECADIKLLAILLKLTKWLEVIPTF